MHATCRRFRVAELVSEQTSNVTFFTDRAEYNFKVSTSCTLIPATHIELGNPAHAIVTDPVDIAINACDGLLSCMLVVQHPTYVSMFCMMAASILLGGGLRSMPILTVLLLLQNEKVGLVRMVMYYRDTKDVTVVRNQRTISFHVFNPFECFLGHYDHQVRLCWLPVPAMQIHFLVCFRSCVVSEAIQGSAICCPCKYAVSLSLSLSLSPCYPSQTIIGTNFVYVSVPPSLTNTEASEVLS